ncbi:hypothetical protein ACHAW6_004030, partial [Cyclotella cf. meneghiniana]
YTRSKIVPGPWKHKTRNIRFVLVVDGFGIKHLKKEDLDHLIKSLEKYYDKALHQFDNVVLTKHEDSPYPHVEPKHGAKQQFKEYDTSAPVGKEEQKYVQ